MSELASRVCPVQVFGEPGGRFRRVRYQRRSRVQAKYQQERETCDRAPAIRRGHVRERHSAAGARVARHLRHAHRAHMHAGRRGRFHGTDGGSHRMGTVKIR